MPREGSTVACCGTGRAITQLDHHTVSAEHGIGQAKVAYLPLSRDPAELAAMESIKAALDPAGILNPGKIL